MSLPTTDLDMHPLAANSTAIEQVPIIDVAQLLVDSNSAAARDAIKKIAAACSSWGFFQVINHGISTTQIEDVWKKTHTLFALPAEEKLKIVRDRENPWGFYNNELTKNQRDKKEVFDFTRAGVDSIYGQSNRWPANQPDFKATMEDFLTPAQPCQRSCWKPSVSVSICPPILCSLILASTTPDSCGSTTTQ